MTIDPNKLPSSPVSDVVMQMESTNEFGEKIRTHDPKVHPNTKIPVNLLFSKTTKNAVLFNGEYMEIYIPTSDLDRNTIIDGQNIKTFGIFEMHTQVCTRSFSNLCSNTDRLRNKSILYAILHAIFYSHISISLQCRHNL